jgi:uncharacterized protein YeaO (DUF488 family)
MAKIQLKRVYEEPSDDDGLRILVERLWPRGLSKEKAQVDQWRKEISPSPELRKWYGHDPEKWPEFQKRYRDELRHNEEAASELARLIKEQDRITFVYAAKDEAHNSALVLKQFLEENIYKGKSRDDRPA